MPTKTSPEFAIAWAMLSYIAARGFERVMGMTLEEWDLLHA